MIECNFVDAIRTTEESVLFAVNVFQWQGIDLDACRQRPVREWSADVRSYNARTVRDGVVYYVPVQTPSPNATKTESSAKREDTAMEASAVGGKENAEGEGSKELASSPAGTASSETQHFRVLAVEIPMPMESEAAGVAAVDSLTEFESEVAVGVNAQIPQTTGSRATLYSVLEGLLQEQKLSAEQRSQLTHAVFSFLQCEVPLSRLYSQMSSIVGYSTLRQVIQQVEGVSDAASKPAPAAVSLGNVVSFRKSQHASYPIPDYCFLTAAGRAAFFASPRVSQNVKSNSAAHSAPWHVDVPLDPRSSHRVGHVAASCAGYIFITGGVLEGQQNPTGWDSLSVVNKHTFQTVEHDLTGSVPVAPFGVGSLIVGSLGSYSSSDCLLVFGGTMSLSVVTDAINSAGRQMQPCDIVRDLRVLDFQSLRWSKVITSEDQSPGARCFPVMVPVLQPRNSGAAEVIGVALYGGLGKPERPAALDDAWYLALQSDQLWRPVTCANNEPLFGAAAVCAGPNRWLICGGYGASEAIRVLSVHVDPCNRDPGSRDTSIRPGESRNDLRGAENARSTRVRMVLEPLPNSQDHVCGRRAFCSGIIMKAEGAQFEPVELGTTLHRTTPTAKNLLFLSGGATDQELPLCPISVFEVISDGEAIIALNFLRTVQPQTRPGCPYMQNPLPRLCETSTFIPHVPFHQKHLTRQPPCLPGFFVSGGFSVSNTRSTVPVPVDFSSTELITLHSVDPYRLTWNTTDGREADGREVVGSKDAAGGRDARDGTGHMTQDADRLLHAAEIVVDDDLETLSILDKRGVTDETRNMFKLFEESTRHNPKWLKDLCFTPGLLVTLGTMVPWPFTAIGGLMENSCHLTTRASHVALDIGLAKNGQFFLSFSDNGKGLGYSGMHKVLKRFGIGENRLQTRDHQRSHSAVQYGLGCKIALSRLGQECLLISRTSGCLGVSLMSQRFLKDIGAGSIGAAPSCFWKLPSRDTVLGQNEHLTSQRKLIQYSPFKTINSLAEQINILGLHTGTRFVYFDHQKTFFNEIGLDPEDGLARLTGKGLGSTSSPGFPGLLTSSSGKLSTEEMTRADEGGEGPGGAALSSTGCSLLNPADKLISLHRKIPLGCMAQLGETGGDLPGAEELGRGLCHTCPLSGESFMVTSAPVRRFVDTEGFSSLYDSTAVIQYPKLNPEPGLVVSSSHGHGTTIDAETTIDADRQVENQTTMHVEERERESDPQSDPNTNRTGPQAVDTATDSPKNRTGTSTIRTGSTFPLWTHSKYSIDQCLSTYMYWALLFNVCRLHCNGWALTPVDGQPTELISSSITTRADSLEDNGFREDLFKHSLYRYMKRRLNAMVELDWLFTPSDSNYDTYGLLGFVNPLEALTSTQKMPYHETGILLYYKERLIRRLFVPFPAPAKLLDEVANRPYPPSHFKGKPTFLFPCTGIIHVPEWLYPNAAKDDFVAQRSPVFDEFVVQVKHLVRQYLLVCLDDDARTAWIQERGKEFLKEAGRRRPLSPLLHVALLKKS
ncbi:GHKL domain protein [Gregarina niphandrodes]|uniref:GHKL domain protein n=1 Tax=Gregarina niphandrodes TaxID=110365 RepID=A0A023B681_GRENI|nr:GHKL domain protein [Gregarina niphandrodes]EZG63625.1 GHKL domain protein [Gregarina niphandrodes]|eukprot:XP_011130665.1 GHKL domain protein [Gregarina niphandrodes]